MWGTCVFIGVLYDLGVFPAIAVEDDPVPAKDLHTQSWSKIGRYTHVSAQQLQLEILQQEYFY